MENVVTESGKFDINGYPIWYEQFGTGPNILLMIPGAIGTGRTDYYEQLLGKNALDLTQFTAVTIELPGWGRSRPPIRKINKNAYNFDADCCVKLMEALGHKKFMALGWSEGARVGLVLSANHPDHVTDLVVAGIPCLYTEQSTNNILNTRNIENWGPNLVENYLRAYKDEKEVQDLWRRHMIFIANFPDYFPNGVCNKKYETIKCRILVIHGDKDPLVEMKHPLHLIESIKTAELKRFPLGSHNLHRVYTKEFKSVVEDFLLNTCF